MKHLVAFTGAAGAGKSTAARLLIDNHGYTLVKFATTLKNMMRAIGLSEDQIEGNLKERPAQELCGMTPRYAMQTLGTEWGRNLIGYNVWTNLWSLEAVKHKRVVVDDCRFDNEADSVYGMGGTIIKIVGRGGIYGNHESEKGLDRYDATVVNDSCETVLYRRIMDAILENGE